MLLHAPNVLILLHHPLCVLSCKMAHQDFFFFIFSSFFLRFRLSLSQRQLLQRNSAQRRRSINYSRLASHPFASLAPAIIDTHRAQPDRNQTGADFVRSAPLSADTMQSAHLLRRRPASAASTCWRAAAALSAVRASPCVVATPASASAQRTMRPMHCGAVRLHQRRGQGHGHGHSHSHAEMLHDEHEHDAKAPLKATAPTTAAPTTAAATPTAAAAASPTAVAADAPPAKGPRYYLRKIKAMLQHYTLGAKLLWKNVKTSRAIRKKSVDVHSLPATVIASAAASTHSSADCLLFSARLPA